MLFSNEIPEDENVGKDEIKERKPPFRSLSSKFSTFNLLLLGWVVLVILLWDVRSHTFSPAKGIVLCVVAIIVAGAISQFTIRTLARPVVRLQQGITSVREGRFEPIQISSTNDEIEDLGRSFNRMIEELLASQREIQQHRELLEDRIRQRTEELENAMRTALAASKAKSEFLANMSHELRTPMNGLLGMLDVVLDSKLDNEQRDHLETAQRSAYSLLALLNDILDLSKIEAGKMALEKLPFNLRTVLDDCVKAYQAKAVQKRVAIHLEIDSSAPRDIIGDPLRVRQIVTNLLSNAVKFTEHGWISVRLSSGELAVGGNSQPPRRNVIIEVSDTGTGIEAEKLVTIFDKFTQADGSITRKYGGTGLGLAITKKLVEMHGGSVDVESQVGKGSTFRIILPCETPGASGPVPEPPVKPAAKALSGPFRAATILLVEDNPVNQKVVLAILKKKGYRIDVANDGRQALAMLEGAATPYDLVLMDIQMPVFDGLETTRMIRRNSRWEKLPIIAMTAHAMNGDRERCLKAGMSGYISKPVRPDHLISTIEQHLESTSVQPAIETPNRLERVLTDSLMGEQTEMANDLLQVFLQLAPERLGRLEAAADQKDFVTLSAEARKIAVAGDQLASRTLNECARRLERAAERGDFEAALQDLATLREEIRALAPVAN